MTTNTHLGFKPGPVIFRIYQEHFERYLHKPFPRRGTNLDEYMDDILDMLSPVDGPALTADHIVKIRRVKDVHEEFLEVFVKM